MNNRIIYLDNNSTTRPFKEVSDEISEFSTSVYGNPSSSHSFGNKSETILNDVRYYISDILGCFSDEIIFTHSGSESNNLAIFGFLQFYESEKNHIIITQIEHSSIINQAKFFQDRGLCEVTFLSVDEYGRIDLEELEKSIRPNTRLISVIHGNNEIGTLQDIDSISQIAKKTSIPLHVDATQTFPKIILDISRLNISMITFSGHKFHALKGVGFLYKKRSVRLKSILFGGDQEGGIVPGTEPLLNIFSVKTALQNFSKYYGQSLMRDLNEYLQNKLKENFNVRFNGMLNFKHRMENNLSFSFPGVDSQEIINFLSTKNIFVSAGSACTSKKSYSHVLKAIGLGNDYIQGTVRVGLSYENNQIDMDTLIDSLSLFFSKTSKKIEL